MIMMKTFALNTREPTECSTVDSLSAKALIAFALHIIITIGIFIAIVIFIKAVIIIS